MKNWIETDSLKQDLVSLAQTLLCLSFLYLALGELPNQRIAVLILLSVIGISPFLIGIASGANWRFFYVIASVLFVVAAAITTQGQFIAWLFFPPSLFLVAILLFYVFVGFWVGTKWLRNIVAIKRINTIIFLSGLVTLCYSLLLTNL